MSLAKLKEKGQITLPADIRKQLDVGIGDLFQFEIIGEKIVMTPQKLVPANEHDHDSKGVDISKYIGAIAGSFGSAKEIDEAITEERDTWD